jgi:hypothetical protein
MQSVPRALASCTAVGVSAAATERQLVTNGLEAHWPLRDDVADVGPHRLVTENRNVLLARRTDDPGASFDGRGAHLHVLSGTKLELGRGDFSIALWLKPSEEDDDPGDILSAFDPVRRRGFQLSLRDNTVTSSKSNTRQLQFGIDHGSEATWRDEGRPGNTILPFALVVHEGKLYAGTCEPGHDEAGHVYRYDGPGRWSDLGTPDRANAVSAMISYRGQLHVGTAKYRLEGSALPESKNEHPGGGVYRLASDGGWQKVAQLPCEAIGGMATYRHRLYVSSLYKPAGLFRFEEDGSWSAVPTPGFRVVALAVYDGFLWASSYDNAWVARYDGSAWKVFDRVGENTQTYSFAILGGRLCVGTWPSGRVYRLGSDEKWEDMGQLGEEKEVMGMAVHNGKLYGGTLPRADIFRFDGGKQWAQLRQIDNTPDVLYRRAWTMAQYTGRLFISTLPSGKVYSMEAGRLVTYDRELSPGWRHVVAQRSGGELQLWVDGQRVAQSGGRDADAFSLDGVHELKIGSGEVASWNGRLRDVRIYKRALAADEISILAATSRVSP